MHARKSSDEEILVLPVNPENFYVYKAQGQSLFRKGFFRKAIEAFDKVLQIEGDRDVRDVYVQQSKCFLQLGDVTSALQRAGLSLVKSPRYVKGLLQKAECLFIRGDLEEALIFFHRGSRLRPGDPEFHKGIFKCQAAIENAIGNPDTVRLTKDGDLTFLEEQCVTKRPGRSAPRQATSLQRKKRKKVDKPKPVYKKVENDKTVKELLGELYGDRLFLEKLLHDNVVDTPAAQKVYDLAIDEVQYIDARTEFWQTVKPLYTRHNYKIYNSCIKQNEQQRKTTVKIMEELQAVQKDQESGMYDRSMKKALRCLSTVQTVKGEDLENRNEILMSIHHSIGTSFLELQKFDKALEHFRIQQHLADNLTDTVFQAKALCSLGQTYLGMNQYYTALGMFENLLKYKKDLNERAAVYLEIAHCHHLLGNFDQALNNENRVIKTAVESANVALEIDATVLRGKTEMETGQLVSALSSLQKALKLQKYSTVPYKVEQRAEVEELVAEIEETMANRTGKLHRPDYHDTVFSLDDIRGKEPVTEDSRDALMGVPDSKWNLNVLLLQAENDVWLKDYVRSFRKLQIGLKLAKKSGDKQMVQQIKQSLKEIQSRVHDEDTASIASNDTGVQSEHHLPSKSADEPIKFPSALASVGINNFEEVQQILNRRTKSNIQTAKVIGSRATSKRSISRSRAISKRSISRSRAASKRSVSRSSTKQVRSKHGSDPEQVESDGSVATVIASLRTAAPAKSKESTTRQQPHSKKSHSKKSHNEQPHNHNEQPHNEQTHNEKPHNHNEQPHNEQTHNEQPHNHNEQPHNEQTHNEQPHNEDGGLPREQNSASQSVVQSTNDTNRELERNSSKINLDLEYQDETEQQEDGTAIPRQKSARTLSTLSKESMLSGKTYLAEIDRVQENQIDSDINRESSDFSLPQGSQHAQLPPSKKATTAHSKQGSTHVANDHLSRQASSIEAGSHLSRQASSIEAGSHISRQASKNKAGSHISRQASSIEAGSHISRQASSIEAGSHISRQASLIEAGSHVSRQTSTNEAGSHLSRQASKKEAASHLSQQASKNEELTRQLSKNDTNFSPSKHREMSRHESNIPQSKQELQNEPNATLSTHASKNETNFSISRQGLETDAPPRTDTKTQSKQASVLKSKLSSKQSSKVQSEIRSKQNSILDSKAPSVVNSKTGPKPGSDPQSGTQFRATKQSSQDSTPQDTLNSTSKSSTESSEGTQKDFDTHSEVGSDTGREVFTTDSVGSTVAASNVEIVINDLSEYTMTGNDLSEYTMAGDYNDPDDDLSAVDEAGDEAGDDAYTNGSGPWTHSNMLADEDDDISMQPDDLNDVQKPDYHDISHTPSKTSRTNTVKARHLSRSSLLSHKISGQHSVNSVHSDSSQRSTMSRDSKKSRNRSS